MPTIISTMSPTQQDVLHGLQNWNPRWDAVSFLHHGLLLGLMIINDGSRMRELSTLIPAAWNSPKVWINLGDLPAAVHFRLPISDLLQRLHLFCYSKYLHDCSRNVPGGHGHS
jgi:hypothetical protein